MIRNVRILLSWPVAPEMTIVSQLAQIQLAYKVKQTQPIALTVTIQL